MGTAARELRCALRSGQPALRDSFSMPRAERRGPNARASLAVRQCYIGQARRLAVSWRKRRRAAVRRWRRSTGTPASLYRPARRRNNSGKMFNSPPSFSRTRLHRRREVATSSAVEALNIRACPRPVAAASAALSRRDPVLNSISRHSGVEAAPGRQGRHRFASGAAALRHADQRHGGNAGVNAGRRRGGFPRNADGNTVCNSRHKKLKQRGENRKTRQSCD